MVPEKLYRVLGFHFLMLFSVCSYSEANEIISSISHNLEGSAYEMLVFVGCNT